MSAFQNHLVSAAAAAVLLTPFVRSQGPAADLLPADSAFVAHFELGRIASVLDARELLAELGGEDADEVFQVLDLVKGAWDLDPFRDVVSLTVFDRELPEDTPGLMLVVRGGATRALDALEDSGALQRERRRGLVFHRMYTAGVAEALGIGDVDADDDDSAALYIHELSDDHRAILIGEHTRDIVDAARVLAGEADSLADVRRPALTMKPSRGCLAYVEISTSLAELTRRTPASELARRINSVVGEITEQQGTLGLKVTARTSSRGDAENVAAVVNGLRGLVALADIPDDVPEAVRDAVMNSHAEADGSSVTVELSASLEQLRGLVEEQLTGRRRSAKSNRRRYENDDHDRDHHDQDRQRRGKKRRYLD